MHLTVRMAWHDNNWNGKVCDNPEANVYCIGTHSLLAERIANTRNVNLEQLNCGKSICELMETHKYITPCYWSINAFGKEKVDFEHPHPFKNIHYTITDTLKPYSVYTWPFRLSFVHSDKNKLKYGNYPPDLENKVKRFIKKFKANESVVFFYANYDNPISADDTQYLLLGCSLISGQPKITEFPLTDSEMKSWRSIPKLQNFPKLNWALQYTHDFDNYGVLLPYKEYLAYVEQNPEDEEKLAEMRVVIDEPAVLSAFKYVGMDIDDDKCLYLLYKIRKSLLKIIDHGFIANIEETEKKLKTINKLIEIVWEKRGLYPSFSKILKNFDFEEKDAFNIQEIINSSKMGLTELFESICNGEVPEELEDYEDELLELGEERSFYKNTEFIKTLSLLNLTDHQIEKMLSWISEKDRKEFIDAISNNPYILFEEYSPEEDDLDNPDLWDEPIDIFKIDIALIPDIKFVKKDKKLQKIKADSPQRLRSVIIQHLYNIGNLDGDCYDTDENIINSLLQYPLFYKTDIKIDKASIMELDEEYRTHFEDKIYLESNNNTTYYYLKEVKFAEELMKKVYSRLSKKLYKTEINLTDYIEESIIKLKGVNPNFDENQFRNERSLLFRNVFNHAFYLLTGKAGAGKTEETTKIISVIKNKLNQEIEVLAPTGKAALRLTEKLHNEKCFVNINPKTIDRFIYEHGYGELLEGITYRGLLELKGIKKIKLENLIIDETSMVDLFKMAILFSILDIDNIKRIILVGDEHQLPPIGFGKPFRDYIDKISANESLYGKYYIRLISSCRFAQHEDETALELAEIFTSRKRNYEAILSKVDIDGFESQTLKIYKWKNKTELYEKLFKQFDDLIENNRNGLEENDNFKVCALNLELGLYKTGYVKNSEPSSMNLEEIQILTPYRAGHYGTLSLNKHIQQEYRDSSYRKDSVFTHADKIIRTANWYSKSRELLLSNGSIGIINFHSGKDKKYYFKERSFKYIDGEENFELAYAITVHKSQGSDFENVFLVIPEKYSLLSKELVYTALTRSKRKVFLFIQDIKENSLLQRAKNISFIESRNTSIFTEPQEKTGGLQPKKGVFVKSKVEYIIFKALEASGLMFEYEKKLKLPGCNYDIHPDFTIMLSDNRMLYWEHLGMLDKGRYFKDWQARRDDYNSIGMFDSVITTDDLNGIDEDKLSKVINDIRTGRISCTKGNPYSNHHYELY